MFSRKIPKSANRALVSAICVGVVCTMFAGVALAQQEWDKRTRVTFSAPVEIPGPSAQILPAGTYIFKLLDSASNRHIVQIFNAEENHLYATILAIPNYRLQATDQTVMTFEERAVGQPQAIRAWFYPGANWGQEFVYPKARAVELAKVVNVPVLYMPDTAAPLITAPVRTPTEAPVVELRRAPVAAVAPTGQDLPLAQVVVEPPVQAASLPKTASGLPMLALLGFLSLGAAFGMRGLCGRS